MPHAFVLDPSDWLGLAPVLAMCLVLAAVYGLAVVEVAAQSRRPG